MVRTGAQPSTPVLRGLLKRQGIEEKVVEQIAAWFSHHENICKLIKLPAEVR